jgi:hypothetical protein
MAASPQSGLALCAALACGCHGDAGRTLAELLAKEGVHLPSSEEHVRRHTLDVTRSIPVVLGPSAGQLWVVGEDGVTRLAPTGLALAANPRRKLPRRLAPDSITVWDDLCLLFSDSSASAARLLEVVDALGSVRLHRFGLVVGYDRGLLDTVDFEVPVEFGTVCIDEDAPYSRMTIGVAEGALRVRGRIERPDRDGPPAVQALEGDLASVTEAIRAAGFPGLGLEITPECTVQALVEVVAHLESHSMRWGYVD